jgi:hypothetical protein
MEVKSRIYDEMQAILFLRVQSKYADYYNPATPLFGQVVTDHFQSASYDIAEAGKCLSLARGTAAVFHLMRALECGMKELASALKVPYCPSWDAYIGKINTALGKNYKDKSEAERKAEPALRSIVGDLLSVKHAWRNSTMHIEKTYTEEDAEQILITSKSLMDSLTKHLPVLEGVYE